MKNRLYMLIAILVFLFLSSCRSAHKHERYAASPQEQSPPQQVLSTETIPHEWIDSQTCIVYAQVLVLSADATESVIFEEAKKIARKQFFNDVVYEFLTQYTEGASQDLGDKYADKLRNRIAVSLTPLEVVKNDESTKINTVTVEVRHERLYEVMYENLKVIIDEEPDCACILLPASRTNS